MYAAIASETAALNTPNDVEVLSETLQLNAQQQSVLFHDLTSLPFHDSLTRTIAQNNR